MAHTDISSETNAKRLDVNGFPGLHPDSPLGEKALGMIDRATALEDCPIMGRIAIHRLVLAADYYRTVQSYAEEGKEDQYTIVDAVKAADTQLTQSLKTIRLLDPETSNHPREFRYLARDMAILLAINPHGYFPKLSLGAN